MTATRVALVGTGTIGRGWAVLFAKAGYEVSLHDEDHDAIASAIAGAATSLQELAAEGLVTDPAVVHSRISAARSLEEAVAGAAFVQESVPERIEVKQAIAERLSEAAAPDAIISSSCSSLNPDEIFRRAVRPERCLVAHPFNPPHLLPLVELLPSASTSEETLGKTKELMRELGQVPVVIRRAVPGYVANRLQAAVVNEAMHLVAEGVISPGDLDLCMTASLGRRWSFLGPFATMDLNADEGIAGYIGNFRHSYEEIGSDLHVTGPWSDQAVEAVIEARRAELPAEQLQAAREARDRRLLKMLGPSEAKLGF